MAPNLLMGSSFARPQGLRHGADGDPFSPFRPDVPNERQW